MIQNVAFLRFELDVSNKLLMSLFFMWHIPLKCFMQKLGAANCFHGKLHDDQQAGFLCSHQSGMQYKVMIGR